MSGFRPMFPHSGPSYIAGDTTGGTSCPLSGTTALAANAARHNWHIQNLGTNILYVRMGASASSTNYDLILKANSAQDAGDGGVFFDDAYKGVVTVAGTGKRYVAAERA